MKYPSKLFLILLMFFIVCEKSLAQCSASITSSLGHSICQGESTQLQALTGNAQTWLWSGGQTTSSINVSPSIPTIYSVFITNSAGDTCSANISINVYTLPSPNITAQPLPPYCPGNQISLTVNSSFSAYLWSPNGVGQSINVNQNGIYSVTVTNVNGCTGSAQVTITINQNPTANAGPDQSICPGSSVQIGGSPSGTGTAPFSYVWSPLNSLINASSPNPIASPNSNTTYSVIVTDANGCTDTDQMTVSLLSLPVASIYDFNNAIPFVLCGSSNTLTVENTGQFNGVSNFHIDWGDGSAPFSSSIFPILGVPHTYNQQGFSTTQMA